MTEVDAQVPTGNEVSLTAAAAWLDVHYMTAYRYVRSGRLPARKVGAEWRVDAEDLRHVARDRAVGSSPDAPKPARSAVRSAARARLETRMIAGDEAGSWQIATDSMASGATPDEVLMGLVVPAMQSIGDRWEAGELSVADEHRASAVAQRIVGRLGPRFRRRGRGRGDVIVGAAPGDRHALPSSIVADLLSGAGFDVIDLGADVPAECFVETALAAPRLVAVAIAATIDDALPAVTAVVARLRESVPGVVVIAGGGAVRSAELARELGSAAWAPDGRALVDVIEAAKREERVPL